MTIDTYIGRIGAQLKRFGPLAERPLAEIRDHLLDSTHALTEAGMTAEDAELEAIQRFGDAPKIVAELAAVLANERDTMERSLKILSIANLFSAVWGLAAVAMLNPEGELLAMTGVVSIATVAAALACMKRNIEPGTLIVSGVALAAVASAGITWALLGGRASLEPQIAQSLLMGAYLAQGIMAIWAGVRRQKLTTYDVAAA